VAETAVAEAPPAAAPAAGAAVPPPAPAAAPPAEDPPDDPPKGGGGGDDDCPKCEDCPPCKAGAPGWMATFADMATLLMAFFVMILSFAELNVPKYKQISGSMKMAFGVQRLVPDVEPPKAQSIIAQQFSPARAEPTPRNVVRQQTTDDRQQEVELKTENNPTDSQEQGPTASKQQSEQQKQAQEKAEQDAQKVREALAGEIAKGQAQVKVDGEKVVVEVNDPPPAQGATDASTRGRARSGAIPQEQIELFAKVADVQAQVSSQVEVRKPAEGVTDGQKPKQANLDDRYQRIRAELSREIQNGQAEVERKDNQIIIRLAEQGSFRSGSADLQPGFVAVLSKVGGVVAEGSGKVVIEGHTDNVPVVFNERFKSNWDLGAARAAIVADYMIVNAKVNQTRISVSGHADTKPIGDNNTTEGRAKNRRIEVIIDG
jgi:chemotaxis protein MotB